MQRWSVLKPSKYLYPVLAAHSGECYSRLIVSADGPVKALLIAMAQDPAPAVYSLQRLIPERLCFFLPQSSTGLVEADVHPQLSTMPQKWDWIVTPHSQSFAQSHRALMESLPKLLRTWNVHPGELVIDITLASPMMAAAMVLVGLPYSAKVVAMGETNAENPSDAEAVMVGNAPRVWTQSNPWDEEAMAIRQDAAGYFNQGSFSTAVRMFRRIETRVSGGLKPLYKACVDISEGYRQWELFHHRQAWEKLKVGMKALDLASVWGGPPGMTSLLQAIKENVRFLEQLVLDPSEVKMKLLHDFLAHAKRRIEQQQDVEVATRVLLRALAASAQIRLFHTHQVKSWDVRMDQLPESLKVSFPHCYVSHVDGKCQLPFYAQYRLLEELQDAMGRTFFAQWSQMKSLIDATDQAVLGQGISPIKSERFHQLYEMVLKVSGVHERDLPQFPSMTL